MIQASNIKVGVITEELIESLFQEHYSVLTIYASKFLHDMDDSRDVVQNVFVNLLDNKNKIRIHTSMKSHLYTSVKNSCINTLKQRKNHSLHHENIQYLTSECSISSDEILENIEFEYKIFKLIDQLPSQCKRIFKMNRLESYSNGEIADILGISKRTVETQVSKALKVLRIKLMSLCLMSFFVWVCNCIL